MRQLEKAILIISLAFTAATLGAVLVRGEEVEVPPQWRAGPQAVYILSFPGDGSTLSGSVHVSLAVWNANPDEPVRILLDGEEAALIDREGVFDYSWKLRGSHHIAVVGPYAIFEEATFWVRPPPPAPPTVPLQQFLDEMEKQREQITLYMVMATAAGVPAGVWTKKKTKIRSEWAFTLPGAVMAAGYVRMPQLYALIPFGVAWAMTYALAREYADYLAVTIIDEAMIRTFTLPLDDEGKTIDGVSPRYWRTLFVKRRKVTLRHLRYSAVFEFRGLVFKCVVVRGPENYVEKEDEVVINCSPELARALTDSKAIEWLQSRLAESEFRTIFTERALRSLIAYIIAEMERTISDLELDRVKTPDEAVEKVREARERMKKLLQAETAPEAEENVAEAEGAARLS